MEVSPALIRSLIDRAELELLQSKSPPADPDSFERWIEYRRALRAQLARHYEAMLKALTPDL